MTQLALAFWVVLVPTFRYKDGVGLWRCHRCLRLVPCGCVKEEDRDEAQKGRRNG